MSERLSYDYVKDYIEENGDFLISKEYANCQTKLEIQCGICGTKYHKSYNAYQQGSRCPTCLKADGRDKSRQTIEFVKEFVEQQGDKLLSDKYINCFDKLEIQCGGCGNVYSISFSKYKTVNQRCYKCSKERTGEKLRNSIEKVQSIFLEHNTELIGGDYKNNQTKLQVKCLVCGHIWFSTTANAISGYGCPKCASSKGEKIIQKILNDYKLTFVAQYRFDDCRNIKPLPFDIGLWNNEQFILIEYHGEQHYKPIERFGGEKTFCRRKENDQIKEEYCKQHNIPLIIIPYWEKNNIESILIKELNLKVEK